MDRILGGDGDDVLYGEGSYAGILADDDEIRGGDGDDVIYGDSDVLVHQRGGRDALHGGDGDDLIVGDARVLLAGSSASGNKDVIYGGDGDDTIIGDAYDTGRTNITDADTIFGGDGDDVIYGDTYTAGYGTACLDDTIDGGDGDDVIYGDAHTHYRSWQGNDVLRGGAGDDMLYGDGATVIDPRSGPGDWSQYTGTDTFIFEPGSDHDTIGDFSHAENDVLDLTAFELAGFAALDTNGNGMLEAGDANVTATGDGIELDLSGMAGDAANDDTVRLIGLAALVEADMLL